MYTTDEILKMLNDGQDPEAIAKTFTDALNDALKAKKAADEEKEKAEKLAATKLKDAETLADHFNAFVDIYYPTIADNNTGEQIIKALDSIAKTSEQLDKINDMINKAFADFDSKVGKSKTDTPKRSAESIKKTAETPKKSEDSIREFLKKYDLL